MREVNSDLKFCLRLDSQILKLSNYQIELLFLSFKSAHIRHAVHITQ
jgi:hypothetical protein